MKIRINVSIIVLMFSITTGYSNPNYVISLKPHFDKQGRLVTPDKILLAKGLKAYQDGYYKSAMIKFKQSAAFGNSKAEELLGLMYIKALGVSRSWAKGYAWIRLAAMDSTQDHINLRNSINAKLNNEEKIRAEIEYTDLLKVYDQSLALNRRSRWVSMQMQAATGTRTGSQTVNVQTQAINGVKKDNDKTSRLNEVQSFVDDYNFGIINSGEIKGK